MSSKDFMDEDVQKTIEELRRRVKNATPPEMYKDCHMFYRFLKAREFDIDKTEAMFRKHLTFRKTCQMDTIVETFQPKEVFVKYIKSSIIGRDKEGDFVIFSPLGNLDLKSILKCLKLSDYQKHWMWQIESLFHYIKKQNEETRRNNFKVVAIFDLENLSFENATNKTVAELMVKLALLMQDHYPERLKTVYTINAPTFYVIAYSIIKSFLSIATIQKVHVFGRSGWKDILLNVINDDVLPAFLGGTRTDPDGNPLCISFVNHGGEFPSKYFLTDEERWFKDKSLVKILKIGSTQKEKVFVEVTESESLIHWEFEVKKRKDIGFGLFYQNRDNDVEVIPIQKVSTADGTEIDSYKATLVGKYIIIFDNSYSWINTKEVHYIVTVEENKP